MDSELGTRDQTSSRATRSDARRQKLLATARRLFAVQGFHRTGMSQIAHESGIAIGQIYRDFANKEAIIVALSEEILQDWLEEAALDCAIAKGDFRRVGAWIMRMLLDECSFEERRMLIEVIAEAARSPIIAELNFKILTRSREMLDRALLSLAPESTPTSRVLISNLIHVLSWGMAVSPELDAGMDRATLRDFAAQIVRREIGLS